MSSTALQLHDADTPPAAKPGTVAPACCSRACIGLQLFSSVMDARGITNLAEHRGFALCLGASVTFEFEYTIQMAPW